MFSLAKFSLAIQETRLPKLYTSAAYIAFPIFRSQIIFGYCFHYQHKKVSVNAIPNPSGHVSLIPSALTHAVGMQAAALSISSICASGLLQMKNILCTNGAFLRAELSVIFISQAV